MDNYNSIRFSLSFLFAYNVQRNREMFKNKNEVHHTLLIRCFAYFYNDGCASDRFNLKVLAGSVGMVLSLT